MDPAHLAELRRQRELVREHLAWLDREIAGATVKDAGPVAVAPDTADKLTAQATAELQSLESFLPNPESAARDTRRGCLMYTAAAMLLGILMIVAIYFARYRDHPLIVVPHATTSGG